MWWAHARTFQMSSLLMDERALEMASRVRSRLGMRPALTSSWLDCRSRLGTHTHRDEQGTSQCLCGSQQAGRREGQAD